MRKEVKVSSSKVKKKKASKNKDDVISSPKELIIEVPQQNRAPKVVSNAKRPLSDEIIDSAWPVSNERIENLIITNKRCQFSNEAISIKPVTAIPGIGKKYGQLLADHGFIYARQLLGYHMMLKDSEMFRKWLEYRFRIPRFRAAEMTQISLDHSISIVVTSALNEVTRRTL